MCVKRLIGFLVATGLVVLPFTFASRTGAGAGQAWEQQVVRALAASGAEYSDVELTARAVVSERFLSGEEAGAMAARVAASLGVANWAETGVVSKTASDPYYTGSVVQAELPDALRLLVTVQSLKGDSGLSGSRDATNLIVSIVHRLEPEVETITVWAERVAAVFNTEGAKPSISVIGTGAYPGRLSPEEMGLVIDRVFQFLRARRVQDITGDGVISASGYSPALLPAIRVAGRRVNLNVALRYHTTGDGTYLQIGSPLLDGEY